ncbi:MAG: hypothetical protein ACOY0T_11835 [Myxococcota bacterium]
MVRAGALLILLGLSTGCSEPLSHEECETLLDRYVSLLAASDRPNTSDAELLRLKTQAREKARHDPAFLRCGREVSRSQFQCAMKAENADRLEQCLL